MKAIILAAGEGSRMGKLTQNIPKPLVNVNGKSIIERQLSILKQNDMVFFNNSRVMHGRTSFKDAENIEKKRLMIRTWIKDKKHLDNNPKIITRKNIKDLEDELKKLGYITWRKYNELLIEKKRMFYKKKIDEWKWNKFVNNFTKCV